MVVVAARCGVPVQPNLAITVGVLVSDEAGRTNDGREQLCF